MDDASVIMSIYVATFKENSQFCLNGVQLSLDKSNY